jgi:hypothetical protein
LRKLGKKCVGLSDQKCREHLVASNRCDDRSPDLRFGVVPGVGRPIPSGIPSAQNHFTINITNQPGALIDVGKLNEISSATLFSAPALLPAPGTQPVPRTNLRPNDLRRSLHRRTATSAGQLALNNQSPSAPPAAALPTANPSGPSTSTIRRRRAVRAAEERIAKAIASGLPTAAASDQMSELLLEFASLRKEVHANRKPSPAPVDPRQRAPSSPTGPAPELFEDTRLRISMEHCYYPLRAGTAATPSLMTSSARPSGPDRPFRPLRDSDRLLRRRPPRSRSPQRSPDPPLHRPPPRVERHILRTIPIGSRPSTVEQPTLR